MMNGITGAIVSLIVPGMGIQGICPVKKLKLDEFQEESR